MTVMVKIAKPKEKLHQRIARISIPATPATTPYQTMLSTALSILICKHKKLAHRLVLSDVTHVSLKLLEHELGVEGLERLPGCGQTEGISFPN
jgi:hypothetical protein